MNSAPAVMLSPHERTKLESLATARLRPLALRRRARAILLCAEGNTNLEVAREIGITNLTVGRWRRKFLLNRLKHFTAERRGRPVRPLVLTSAERGTLQGWSRSPSVSAGLATRACVILACAQGASDMAVATEAGLSELTVGKLRRRFLSHRLVGLTDLLLRKR
jgi:uncharacterized protein YerC